MAAHPWGIFTGPDYEAEIRTAGGAITHEQLVTGALEVLGGFDLSIRKRKRVVMTVTALPRVGADPLPAAAPEPATAQAGEPRCTPSRAGIRNVWRYYTTWHQFVVKIDRANSAGGSC